MQLLVFAGNNTSPLIDCHVDKESVVTISVETDAILTDTGSLHELAVILSALLNPLQEEGFFNRQLSQPHAGGTI